MFQDLLEEIDYWMKRLDDETESRETEVLKLKVDLEKITFDLRYTKNKYEERIAAIEDWLKYKNLKQEKEKQEERKIQSAIKIQV